MTPDHVEPPDPPRPALSRRQGDLAAADPLAEPTPGPWAYVMVLGAPAVWLGGAVVDGSLRAPAPGAWAAGVPVLAGAAFLATANVLARARLLEPRPAPAPGVDTRLTRGRPWVRRWVVGPVGRRALDLPAVDASGFIGPALATFAGGVGVLVAAHQAALGLAARTYVPAGAARLLTGGLNVVGSLGVGVVAGSAAALFGYDLLVVWLGYRHWRREAEFRAAPDRAAAAAISHAARLLAAPWDAATQAWRRREVRRRLALAARLAELDVRDPQVRLERRAAAAALCALVTAVYNSGDPARVRVRRALLKAAPLVAEGRWLAAEPILTAAAASGLAARRAAYSGPVRRRSTRRSVLTLGGLVALAAVLAVGFAAGAFRGVGPWYGGAPGDPSSDGVPAVVPRIGAALLGAALLGVWAVLQAKARQLDPVAPVVAAWVGALADALKAVGTRLLGGADGEAKGGEVSANTRRGGESGDPGGGPAGAPGGRAPA